MGLDMYLTAEKFIPDSDFGFEDGQYVPRLRPDYAKIVSLFPEWADEKAPHKSVTLNLTIGYWRKANAIHDWFVTNVAGGVDDCRQMYVPDPMLRNLRATVEHVLEVHTEEEARRLLPPAEGFFFGTYDIDEWYWESLKETVEMLNKAITLAEDNHLSIYYRASW